MKNNFINIFFLVKKYKLGKENKAKKNALLTRFKSSEEGYIYESGI